MLKREFVQSLQMLTFLLLKYRSTTVTLRFQVFYLFFLFLLVVFCFDANSCFTGFPVSMTKRPWSAFAFALVCICVCVVACQHSDTTVASLQFYVMHLYLFLVFLTTFLTNEFAYASLNSRKARLTNNSLGMFI